MSNTTIECSVFCILCISLHCRNFDESQSSMYLLGYCCKLVVIKERRGYSHLKEEALDRTMWTDRFGRSFEPVVRQTDK
jgi:hypothetical protein